MTAPDSTLKTVLPVSDPMATYERVDSPDATTLFDYHDLTPPTVADVYAARSVVESIPTSPSVSSTTGRWWMP